MVGRCNTCMLADMHRGDDVPKHDGFDPLAAFAVGKPHAKRACVAGHQRLTKLVAIVARPIAGIDQDLCNKRTSSNEPHTCDNNTLNTIGVGIL